MHGCNREKRLDTHALHTLREFANQFRSVVPAYSAAFAHPTLRDGRC
jgi:hypothetical protein